MNILGISAYYHDSAACLLVDGAVRAAAQEERFSRVKNDHSFPQQAARYCISALKPGERINALAFYDNFGLKRLRSLSMLTRYRGISNFLSSLANWSKFDEFFHEVERLGLSLDLKSDVHFVRHHVSHAASAFFCSPFSEASVVTVDGVGEFDTTAIGEGAGTRLKLLKTIEFPHSLGLFYSAFTLHLGFKVNSGEYKVMGLAPLGVPTMVSLLLDHVIELRDDGSFRLNLDIFRFHNSKQMIDHGAIEKLFGVERREESTPLDERHRNLAASIQLIIEEAMFNLCREAIKTTGKPDLCFAGGVALNCSALGKLRNRLPQSKVYVQPAAGDAGGALGASLALWYARELRRRLNGFHCYLGPSIDDNAAEEFFIKRGFPYRRFDSLATLSKEVAMNITQGREVAWCRGAMEWGPRALGARSILANPLKPHIRRDLNLRIKKRESFRPFAPMVLEDCLADLFINPERATTMSFVFFLRDELRATDAVLKTGRHTLTAEQFRLVKDAVIHADWSARVQSISSDSKIYPLLSAFYEWTGCPILINTSLNVRGEPIVNDHWAAYKCFWRAQLDILVVGNMLLRREEQPMLAPEELEEFEPD